MHDSAIFSTDSWEEKCQKTIDQEKQLAIKIFEDLRIECESEDTYSDDDKCESDSYSENITSYDDNCDYGDDCYDCDDYDYDDRDEHNDSDDNDNFFYCDYVEHQMKLECAFVSGNLNKIKEVLNTTLQLTRSNEFVNTIMNVIERLCEYERDSSGLIVAD